MRNLEHSASNITPFLFAFPTLSGPPRKPYVAHKHIVRTDMQSVNMICQRSEPVKKLLKTHRVFKEKMLPSVNGREHDGYERHLCRWRMELIPVSF